MNKKKPIETTNEWSVIGYDEDGEPMEYLTTKERIEVYGSVLGSTLIFMGLIVFFVQ